MGYVDLGRGGTSTPANTTTNLDLSSSTGFTYDSAVIEFANGVSKLKNQFASDIVWAAKLDTTINATYSKNGGSLTGTATGVASISGGKLVMTGGSAARVDYNPLNNWVIASVAAFRCLYTPNYTGSPATSQRMFYTGTTTLGDTGRFDIVHLSNGNLALNAHDANGGVSTIPFGAWSPTADVEYEILMEMNYTTGAHKVFVDGAVLGTDNDTGTRHYGAAIMRFGVDFDETGVPNHSIRNVLIYNATQKTTTYTPGYTVASSPYLTTDPTVKHTAGITAATLVSFTAGVTAAGSDGVRFYFEVDGTAKYWNGSAWVASAGTYAQSNTATDVDTNWPTLVSATSTIKAVAVLHSADGTTTPTCQFVTMVYR